MLFFITFKIFVLELWIYFFFRIKIKKIRLRKYSSELQLISDAEDVPVCLIVVSMVLIAVERIYGVTFVYPIARA